LFSVRSCVRPKDAEACSFSAPVAITGNVIAVSAAARRLAGSRDGRPTGVTSRVRKGGWIIATVSASTVVDALTA
jgi:hypothetical protein